MAALRSLTPEQEDGPLEELHRHRDNHRCSLCGDDRDTCTCRTPTETLDHAINDHSYIERGEW